MTNKLIKDMDEATWNKFIAFCKLKNIKVNKELEELLNNHLDKNLKKMFEGGKSK